MKKIIVAFANMENADRICDILVSGNYRVEATCQTGAQVLHRLNSVESENALLIMGYKLADMTALQLVEMLPGHMDVLLLLTANQYTLCADYNLFSLTMPVKKGDLHSTVRMFFETTRSEISKPTEKAPKRERTAEDKAIITQAKAVLMERHHMTEEQAHRFIQKRSMDSSLNMLETAKIIISD